MTAGFDCAAGRSGRATGEHLGGTVANNLKDAPPPAYK